MVENSPPTLFSTIRECVNTWCNMIRSIIIIIICLGALTAALYFLLGKIGPEGIHLITSEGTSIKIGMRNEEITLKQVLVHPQGWIDSRIDLEKDDRVTLFASGHVNFALGPMIESLDKTNSIKAKNYENKKSRSERDFDQNQISESLFNFPWTGPTGLPVNKVWKENSRIAIKKDRIYRVVPNARLGQLIALVNPMKNRRPYLNEPLPEGVQVIAYNEDDMIFVAKYQGRLYFIVNELTDKRSNYNEVVWQDNIGFFSVTIKIERKK